MARTPAFGYPTHAAAIEGMRADLRTHVESCDRELGVIRDDVKGLIKVNAAQTGKLDMIQQSLARRARTEDATEAAELEVKTTKRTAWWKAVITGLIGAAFAGLGALIHYLVS